MKFAIVILACIATAAYGQFKASAFAGFNNYNSGRYNSFNNGRYNYNRQPQYRPVVPVAPVPTVPEVPFAPVVVPVSRTYYNGDARSAQTLREGNEVNPDGSYSYFYETDNGIAAQEQGTPRNFGGNPPVVPDVAQGSFSWTSPEGKVVSISYVADENGYQPQGDAIPQPPPIPPQIARALEYIARRNGQ